MNQQSKIIILGFLILFWLLLLLLPFPVFLLDFALSLQFALSFLFLLFTLQKDLPIHLQAILPKALMVLILMRLTLNLATTRSILSIGNAGSLIDQIAQTVLKGDWVIGVVLFGIFTVIQMVVITQGSERIAQVMARFSLDQMSALYQNINQALQQKLISQQEANLLQKEIKAKSDLSAILDGVLKWVKGDAIANFLLLLINFIGGLSIAILRDESQISDAISQYGQLTIGDALMAQIPALMTTVGISFYLIHLEDESIQSKISQPSEFRSIRTEISPYLLVSAMITFCIGSLPGVDIKAVGLVALILGLSVDWRSMHLRSMIDHWRSMTDGAFEIQGKENNHFIVEMSLAAYACIEQDWKSYQSKSHPLFFSVNIQTKLPKNSYQIFNHQQLLHQDDLYPLFFSINRKQHASKRAIHLKTSIEGSWDEIGEESAWDYLILQLKCLNRFKRKFPINQHLQILYGLKTPIKKELIPQKLSEWQCVQLMGLFHQEGIVIDHPQVVLESLCFDGQIHPKMSLEEQFKFLRLAMKDQLCLEYCQTFQCTYLDVILIHPDLLQTAQRQTWGNEEWEILEIELDPLLQKRPFAVLLVPQDLRFTFVHLIHQKYPYLTVLATEEISSKIKIQQLGMIGN
jgi:flagellar biosynthesis component FlhA